MKMTGLYHIALLPNADEQAFTTHMIDVVFTNVAALQATRITTGVDHQLLKAEGAFRRYAWQATVSLMTDKGYDFLQNVERVQQSVKEFGLVVGLDVSTHVES